MTGKARLPLLPESQERPKGKLPQDKDICIVHHADCQSSDHPQKSREETRLDADIDDLLESDVTRDSIIDSEEEEDEDEDEVNSILASDEEL
jgi:hypothetical protein